MLCEGLPAEFIEYFKYIKGLNFEKAPNYAYLKNMFKTIQKN